MDSRLRVNTTDVEHRPANRETRLSVYENVHSAGRQIIGKSNATPPIYTHYLRLNWVDGETTGGNCVDKTARQGL